MLRPIPRTGSKSKGKKDSCVAVSRSNTAVSSGSSNVMSSGSSARASTLTTIVISDDDDDSDVEIVDVEPGVPNYQRILVERATLSSSPAASKVRRDRLIAAAMSSSPATSDKDEVEQHFRTKAAAQTSVTLYVFAKVTNRLPTSFLPIDSISRPTATFTRFTSS